MDYLTEINNLREREKELQCIYRVDEILSNLHSNVDDSLKKLVFCIPEGLQFPGVCSARIRLKNKQFVSSNFQISKNLISESIIAGDEPAGSIEIYYSDYKYSFLPEEKNLLKAICNRVGIFLLHSHLHNVLNHENKTNSSHWQWKKEYAQKLADYTNFEEFKIEAIYLIGSVKNANAGPASDIDLIIHLSEEQPSSELLAWLDAWSKCLAEINIEKSGTIVNGGLLDVHFVNNNSFINSDSYAIMIGSLNNSAVLLKKK